jgi:hypothetical protein
MDMDRLNKAIGHALANYQRAIALKLSSSDIYAFKLAIRYLNKAKAALKAGLQFLAEGHVRTALSIVRFAANCKG